MHSRAQIIFYNICYLSVVFVKITLMWHRKKQSLIISPIIDIWSDPRVTGEPYSKVTFPPLGVDISIVILCCLWQIVQLQMCVYIIFSGVCIKLLFYIFISVCSQYVQNDSPSSKSLAGLVVQLLQFQEDAFGRRVNNPALTKLPVSTTHTHTHFVFLWKLKCEERWNVILTARSSPSFRPSVSWISRQEVLSVTSWGRSTSLRASKGGELICGNLYRKSGFDFGGNVLAFNYAFA